MRSQNHPQIDENPVPLHLVSIQLLPWSSDVPSTKMVPEGAKMEAPSPKMATARNQKGPAADSNFHCWAEKTNGLPIR